VNTDNYDSLKHLLDQHFSITLQESLVDGLEMYHDLLSTWNTSTKLLSSSDIRTRLWEHTLDSLSLLPYLPVADQSDFHYVDVGSGGGLPAIPVLLASNGIHAILFERHQKKATFLQHAVRRLNIENVTIIENTFESTALPSDPRIITCRAVERPESVSSEILAGLMTDDTFLCQLDISRVSTPEGIRVERIDDELGRQGLRRADLHRITRLPD